MRVYTSEQAKIIAECISQERDFKGNPAGPVTYTEDWHTNFPVLEAKEKPVITIDVSPLDVKVTGFVYPLEDLLEDLGFIRHGQATFHLKEIKDAETTAMLAQDARNMATTYGWNVVWNSSA